MITRLKQKIFLLFATSGSLTALMMRNDKVDDYDNDDLYIYATNGENTINDFSNSVWYKNKKYECELENSKKWFNCSINVITNASINKIKKNKIIPQTITENNDVSTSLKTQNNLFKIQVHRNFNPKHTKGKMPEKEITSPININPISVNKNKKSRSTQLTSIFTAAKDKTFGKTKFVIGKPIKNIIRNCAHEEICLSKTIYEWNPEHTEMIEENNKKHRSHFWDYDMSSALNEAEKDKYYLIKLNNYSLINAHVVGTEMQELKKVFYDIEAVFVHRVNENSTRSLIFYPINNEKK